MSRQQLKRHGSKKKSTSWYPGKLLIQALDNQKKTFESLDASRTERDQAWHEFKLGQTRKTRKGRKYIKQVFTRDGWQDASKFKGNPKATTKEGLLQSRLLAITDTQEETADVKDKLSKNKATTNDLLLANAAYDRDSDDPKGAVPFPTNYEGTWVDGKFIPSGTNFSQTPSKGDAEFPTDVKSPTAGAAKEALEELKIKSDVHTIDPETGEAVGVLTRNQRKAFEARTDVRKSLLEAQKNKNDLRIYKNRTAGG